MTTIAYDGKRLVTDSRLTRGNTITTNNCKKLFTNIGDYKAIATFGSQVYIRRFINNISKGLDTTSGDYGAIMITQKNEVFLVDMEEGYEERLEFDPDQPAAWGSGCDHALAAMYAGATAVEAVEIAIRMDIYSGGELQIVELNP